MKPLYYTKNDSQLQNSKDWNLPQGRPLDIHYQMVGPENVHMNILIKTIFI